MRGLNTRIAATFAYTVAIMGCRGGSDEPLVAAGNAATQQMTKAMAIRPSGDADRDFVAMMIPHHEGAIAMVRELFSHGDAGHDETVFRFAADVEADQSAELNKMRLMLQTVPN